jgi:hypothetical protein
VDIAAVKDYSYIEQWYNRDYKEGNSGDSLYDYTYSRSFFKLCEVSETLGKDTTKINFHDVVAAGETCKNMNLYKCVSFCVLTEVCKSVIFYEGPMESNLRVPRYLCVQMRADLDDRTNDGDLFFKENIWTSDLKQFKCPGDACKACSHKSSGGISACKLKEFLKNIDTNARDISPLQRKMGSRLVFLDHLATNRSSVYSAIQSKFHHIIVENHERC